MGIMLATMRNSTMSDYLKSAYNVPDRDRDRDRVGLFRKLTWFKDKEDKIRVIAILD